MLVKEYNRYSFIDYPPTEILDNNCYKDAFKRLSFQYRTKGNEELIAYIALRRESPNVIIPNILHHEKGCRVLNVYVRKVRNKEGFLVSDVALLSALIDEADFDIMAWVDNTEKADFMFDYYWFDISSFDLAPNVYHVSNGWKILKNIVYHTFDRR